MKNSEVIVGESYIVKVSGNLVPVRIIAEYPGGGWIARNTTTNREIRIRTAGRLRRPARQGNKRD